MILLELGVDDEVSLKGIFVMNVMKFLIMLCLGVVVVVCVGLFVLVGVG